VRTRRLAALSGPELPALSPGAKWGAGRSAATSGKREPQSRPGTSERVLRKSRLPKLGRSGCSGSVRKGIVQRTRPTPSRPGHAPRSANCPRTAVRKPVSLSVAIRTLRRRASLHTALLRSPTRPGLRSPASISRSPLTSSAPTPSCSPSVMRQTPQHRLGPFRVRAVDSRARRRRLRAR